MRERRRISVEGVVQGVGFRPFVYDLARSRRLTGSVRNETTGVTIDVEGPPEQLEKFQTQLRSRSPPLARIDRLRIESRAPEGRSDFRIEESRASEETRAVVPPDTATCPACLAELRDPDDRRFRYPFLNCTHCGPRLTVVRDLPYDRSRTTMAGFPLCDRCRREYEDPSDRRFHAQPTACPDCGPTPRLADPSGEDLPSDSPVREAARALRDGRIVAVKGLGGYHLACDATSGAAVRRLRVRKHREARPLAVMSLGLEEARRIVRLGPREEELLTSPRRPIVLLEERAGSGVAAEVAPNNGWLGVMLPYTPLHHLLLEETGGPLVMTSGNRTGDPIAFRDADAFERLGKLADLFLTHDRPIETRCDDSVTRVLRGGEVLIRRSRGYAPEPIPLPIGSERTVLAVGGHLKNTFCLTRGDRALTSHHVGDLENLSAYRALRDGIEHYRALFDLDPDLVAHDLHPDYLSTRLARETEGARRVGVQHHHAHVAACLAEHGETGPAIGVAFDGTGYGEDGAVWGGEVLVADLCEYRRTAHLAYVPLPGGEAAVRAPWRMALSHLTAACGEEGVRRAPGLPDGIDPERWEGVREVLAADVSPSTSSVGRLFDAVAALAGLRREVSFEAQAAMELEAAADPAVSGAYPVRIRATESEGRENGTEGGPGPSWIWDPTPTLGAILEDLESDASIGEVSARFHGAVAGAVVETCERVRGEWDLSRVALTGGVFQNAVLTERTAGELEARGFEPLLHRKVPPNDGGLSYGQAAVALARLRHDVTSD